MISALKKLATGAASALLAAGVTTPPTLFAQPAQEPAGATSDASTDLSVVSGPPEEWISRSDTVRIRLSALPSSVPGRVAVVIGTTDVTDLLRIEGETLTYRSELLPLPTGRQPLTVSQVSPDGTWREIYATELKVRHAGGFEEVTSETGIDLQGLWLAEEGGESEAGGQDAATANISLGGSLARSGWRLSSRFALVGVSEIEQALRFAEREERADRLDLADYALRVERGQGYAEIGHVSFGEHQQLVSSFPSRGLDLALPLGSSGSVRASLVNGTSIAGWDNFTGLNRSEHRIAAGSVGWDLIPSQPGGLRIDADWVDASVLPLAGFNQGFVNDAEESDGWGARLSGSFAQQRVSFRAGFAQSDFSNPDDPLLFQGEDVVAVRGETRDARFAQVDLALVDNREIGEGTFASVRLSLQHERVDPQYRSITAFTQADLERNGADLQASVGAISAQVGHNRSEDNLADIESILKTKTRNSSGNLTLPLGMVWDDKPRPWLPSISFSVQRTHQFGANDPQNGGFDPSHIPDQKSQDHSASLDWSGNRWQAGYVFAASDQDNRQPGRETDDFTNVGHEARVAFSPGTRLDLGADYSRNRAASLGPGRVDRNERVGLNTMWRPLEQLTLTGDLSRNRTADEPFTSSSETTILNLELSFRFAWREERAHGGSGQWFLRYSNQDFESLDGFFGGFLVRDSWTLHTGFNLSLR